MSFPLTRRRVLELGLGSLAGAALSPFAGTAAALARSATERDVLVWVFLVGGLDGLAAVAPAFEAEYYRRRASSALPQGSGIDLDGRFELHPALAPLYPFWQDRRLAIVHGVGLPDPARTHFPAIDAIGRGADGAVGGWLDRHVSYTSPQRGARALHLGVRVPGTRAIDLPTPFAGRPACQHRGAHYPQGLLGHSLANLAARIRTEPELRVASVACGGWDTHESQGGVQGWLAARLDELARGLHAFVVDLADDAERVTLVALSEFGRTVSENDWGGTDHGTGGVAFVLGPHVLERRVGGRWPGLDPEFGALAATTDPREILASLVGAQLGEHARKRVFPSAEPASLYAT